MHGLMKGVKQVEIKLNFYPKFADCLKSLKEKYGEKFSLMNGFSNSNLNFTDFIK